MVAVCVVLFAVGRAFPLHSAKAICTDSSEAFCQYHISFGAEHRLRISWVSVEAGTSPEVRFGVLALNQTSPPVLNLVANASSETYSLDDMCDVPYIRIKGWEEPGTLHHAAVDLTSSPASSAADDMFVWYQVGDAAADLYGPILGPVKVASKGISSKPGRFAIFADMGTYSYAPGASGLGAVDDIVAASLARADAFDAVLLMGDVVYANDGPQNRFRFWFDEVQATMVQSPFMVACGNHDCLFANTPAHPNPNVVTWKGAILDAGTDGGQCGVPHSVRFAMPGDPNEIIGWPEAAHSAPKDSLVPRNNIFYSFDAKGVHFSIVSSEHDLSANSTQIRWLDKDLASVDKALTPFSVLALHRPLYTSTTDGYDIAETHGMRESIEPLLQKYEVQLVMNGHYHQYERTCSVLEGKCVASGGAVHVTAGIGGLQHSADWVDAPAAWSLFRDTDHNGYVLLQVVNNTHLKLDAINAKDDSVFDSSWVLN